MRKKRVLLTREEIQNRVFQMAGQISADHDGKELLLVGVLKGAFIFLADLARCLSVPVMIDFIAVSSYGNSSKTTGVVRILKDLEQDIRGLNVIVVEDIIDTGLTINYLKEVLIGREPATLKICSLLDKPSRRKVDIKPDYNGFVIPDEFVVGYGLDYSGRYRHLKDLMTIEKEMLKR